ncbi:virion structural protein [Pseudomonas phage PspYZU05]|uniref:Small outer capsid protein n=1 Tax=Pseudomonas phage PspYZU05 TaxID=1983556 RepID=A0A2U7NJF6_9CAUD|nr:virion structural protein [Pseudomonas phage PspYZU05]ASD51984.1 hypothetical protein PspYZU05_32 [Pseudomonas phage PspYZU05]
MYINLELIGNGVKVSVDFTVYSNSHRIADSGYKLELSKEPLHTTVFTKEQAAEWRVYNAVDGDMFKPAKPTLPPGGSA